MQETIVTKSIAEIFLAAKILKAIENIVSKKESMLPIDDNGILLEDYLFEDYNFELINTNALNNLIIIDHTGNILNFIGKNFVTESEVINFKNRSNTIVRVNYMVDTNNIKQVTNTIAGIPQITEISGQLSSNDITIKEGKYSNEIKIYDTKTGNYVASAKIIIPEKIQPLIKTVYERVKNLFSNDMKYKSPAYIIGLISSLIITPIYSKVKNLLGSKQENYLYFEAEDELNSGDQEKPNSEDQEKVNKSANKIVALISRFFRGTGKVLKAFVQFLVALLKGVKAIVISLLLTILRIFQNLRALFVLFLTTVASIFIGAIAITGRSLEKVGSMIKVGPIISFAQSLRKLAIIMTEKLSKIAVKEGILKPAATDLQILFKQAKMALEQGINTLEQLMDKETDEIKPKLVKIVNNIIDRSIIKTLNYSVTIITKTAASVKDKSVLADYKSLCDVVNNYISYLSNIIATKKFISNFMSQDTIRDKINNTINDLINKIDTSITKAKFKESNIETYTDVISLLTNVKRNLINLRIS